MRGDGRSPTTTGTHASPRRPDLRAAEGEGATRWRARYFKGEGERDPGRERLLRHRRRRHASTPTATCRSQTAPKDVIKSGGEWISSIDLENLAVGHPRRGGGGGYRQSAHPKWDERPLLDHRPQERYGRLTREDDARLPAGPRSPSGGCRTTWSSSTRSPIRRRARSSRPSSATASGTTDSRRRSDRSRYLSLSHLVILRCGATRSFEGRTGRGAWFETRPRHPSP